MKKAIALMLVVVFVFALTTPELFAANTAKHGKITGKSTVAGLCSLLLWPGIGQYLNNQTTEKNVVHALLGITQIFRFWSGWDALIQRDGGRWDGRI